MAVKLMHDVQFVKFRVNRICLRDWPASGEYDQEVVMRILILLIPMTVLLIGAGCANTKLPGAAEADTPQQVMVQAVFNQADRELASPRVIVLEGEETQIEIGREVAVPGREQPLDTGIVLTIRPHLENGRVRFTGNCRVMTEVIDKHDRDMRVVAIQTREAFFTGTAGSGEIKRVTINSSAGQALEMNLKFTVMVQTAARH